MYATPLSEAAPHVGCSVDNVLLLCSAPLSSRPVGGAAATLHTVDCAVASRVQAAASSARTARRFPPTTTQPIGGAEATLRPTDGAIHGRTDEEVPPRVITAYRWCGRDAASPEWRDGIRLQPKLRRPRRWLHWSHGVRQRLHLPRPQLVTTAVATSTATAWGMALTLTTTSASGNVTTSLATGVGLERRRGLGHNPLDHDRNHGNDSGRQP